MAATSGTTNFAPSSGELVLFALAEAGVRRAQIEEEHLVNARMAANLIFSDWGNDLPHLWLVRLNSIPLVQGVATYQLPADTLLLLDVYLRTWQLPNVSDTAAPDLTTTLGSPIVTIGLTNHGLSPGNWINILIPLSVGGLILLGYYQVATVPNGNIFTVVAGANATAAVVSGGTTPEFTSTALSPTIAVTFPNHGQLSGFTWNIPVATPVGGTTLQGAYTVQSVTDANHFTITAAQEASSNSSSYENGGAAYYAAQSSTVEPDDRILFPFGRSEYASVPNKLGFQAPPTTFWFDRLIAPQVTLYPVPDGNGPYALNYYSVVQLEDVNVTFAESPGIPWRFNDAFEAELAYRMALIYATGADSAVRIDRLEKRRDRVLGRAQLQDTEKVPLYVSPVMRSYWNRR